MANACADYQHKLSRQLIDDNQAVIVETLKIKNLLENRTLAKHIADVSWDSLIKKLTYKAMHAGKHLVKINPWFAGSKTCSCCGHKIPSLPLAVRMWDCPACGTTDIDRDINAAINIRQQGLIHLRAEGLSVPAN
ncbi:RNA-guided endonuclease InsQ/TnpB family protein [Nitrincola tibetensis]|uniref:RNA-guided endonuclease InsQ/TnpB family protein n=1 Tax=Nitrincola tibetensis TaxID=2219697 RepID=UPI001EFC86CF|nr:transposase [Nitrincola tibetensis]